MSSNSCTSQQQQMQQGLYRQRDPLRDLSQVEDDIIQTCTYLRTLRHNKTEAWVNECIGSSNNIQSNNMYPKYDKGTNYYQEFWRTYLLNEMMISKIKEFTGENKLLQNKIGDLDNLHKEYHKIQAARNKKKNRRTAQEIEKSYSCPYSECAKVYGSEVSLNLHIKLKHNGGNKTERERLARSILMAQENNENLPDQTLNFPPGYLDEFKEQYLKDKEKNLLGLNEDGKGFEEEEDEFDKLDSQEQAKLKKEIDEEDDEEMYDEEDDEEHSQNNNNNNNNNNTSYNN